MGASLKLAEAKKLTPAVSGVGAWALAMREAAFNGLTEADMAEAMQAVAKKAKAGDLGAVKLLLGFVAAAGSSAPRQPARPDYDDRHEGRELVGEWDGKPEEHPLFAPTAWPPADPRKHRLVDARIAAGMPAHHPEDAGVNLD